MMRSSSGCTLDSSETRLPRPTTCRSSARQLAASSGVLTCAPRLGRYARSVSRTTTREDLVPSRERARGHFSTDAGARKRNPHRN